MVTTKTQWKNWILFITNLTYPDEMAHIHDFWEGPNPTISKFYHSKIWLDKGLFDYVKDIREEFPSVGLDCTVTEDLEISTYAKVNTFFLSIDFFGRWNVQKQLYCNFLLLFKDIYFFCHLTKVQFNFNVLPKWTVPKANFGLLLASMETNIVRTRWWPNFRVSGKLHQDRHKIPNLQNLFVKTPFGLLKN